MIYDNAICSLSCRTGGHDTAAKRTWENESVFFWICTQKCSNMCEGQEKTSS